MLEHFSFRNITIVGDDAIDLFIIKQVAEYRINGAIAAVFMPKPELP